MAGKEEIPDSPPPPGNAGFHFIDVEPAKATKAKAKSEVRKVIRSHVMREFRRQQRDRKDPRAGASLRRRDSARSEMGAEVGEGSSGSRRGGSSGKEWAALDGHEGELQLWGPAGDVSTGLEVELDASHPEFPDNAQRLSRVVTDLPWEVITGVENVATVEEEELEEVVSQELVSHPVSILGAGRVDPFNDHTVPYINELIDHCVTQIWPGLLPVSNTSVSNPLSQTWLQRTYASPSLYHSFMYAASVHLELLRGVSDHRKVAFRLFHKGEAIRHINSALNDPTTVESEELVLSMLSLGANEIDHALPRAESPFTPPLAGAQWLAVYGRMLFVEAHIGAMLYILTRRGGMETLKLEGLAKTISFADILGATMTLTRPRLPLVLEFPSPSSLFTSSALFSHPLYSSRGSGLFIFSSYPFPPGALPIFHSLARFSTVLAHYTAGTLPSPNITALTDWRNELQHALLQLPWGHEWAWPADALTRYPGIMNLYESLRLTAVIYAAGVTVPVPGFTPLRTKLARWLRVAIERAEAAGAWTGDAGAGEERDEEEEDRRKGLREALLWMLVLGAVAAEETRDRGWFVQRVREVAEVLDVTSWERARDVLWRFLWLEDACDVAGRMAWREALD